ncbi:hypothetical protein LNP18_06050 [Leuconostoc citreum]|uniref:hypothetical protein n=1 Tax=Leuconostoc citreum TaxID=33964 RepID=UPI00200AE19E|nr:hypothetical protein [Leuconostoc citreum]MCK8605664.1 hypothetical protein [Leuconostoc citreum]
MFNFKKKSKFQANYYARIESNRVNFEDDFIQKIAEESGNLVNDWPNTTLSDLQAFLSALTNELVRASDHNLPLGNIVFYEKDDKGRDEPTGLSWDEAELTPEFENIAVSTAIHLFNSSAVRQDEDTDYYMIVDTLQSLIAACLQETDLTEADMPVLPSFDKYKEAQETGIVLPIEAKRFVVHQEEKPELPEEQVAPVQAEPTKLSSSTQTTSTAYQAPSRDSNLAGANDKPNVPDGHVDAYVDAQQLIDRINLKATTFPVQEVAKDTVPESDDYIASRLGADKVKANHFLNQTSLMHTQKVRKTLSAYLKTSQTKLAEAVKAIRETDVAALVANQLETERDHEFNTRLETQKKARKAGFDAELNQENLRHESNVTALKDNYLQDLEQLNVSITKDLDDWYLKRSQLLQDNMQASLVADVKAQETQAHDQLMTGLKTLRDDLLIEHNQSLIALEEQLSQDMNAKRVAYQQEHDEALIQATKLASAKTQGLKLGDLEEQVFTLKKQNAQLNDELDNKKIALNHEKAAATQTLTKLTTEKQQLQDEAETLKQLLDAQKHTLSQQASTPDATNSLNQHLVDLLGAQLHQNAKSNDAQQPTKKRGNGLLVTSVSLLVALAIVGSAVGAYTYGQHQTTASATKVATVTNIQPTGTATTQSSASIQTTQPASSSSQPKETPKQPTSESSSVVTSQKNNPLAGRYHVGETVKATINSQAVNAVVSSIEDQAITLTYGNQSYKVPMPN